MHIENLIERGVIMELSIIINIAVFLVSAVIFTFVGIAIRKKIAESKVGSAENEAKRIIELAQKEAENKRKEEIFKAKEEKNIKKQDVILVDALTGIDTLGIPYKSIIHGDAISYSIACASIIAKVTRDRIMRKMDEMYPQYGFAKHKGYGTAAHMQAIRENGLCPLHRRSFVKNII